MKIKIYIKNSSDYFLDGDVCVITNLPSVPPVGGIVYLGDYIVEALESKATARIEVACRYAPEWFYCRSCNIQKKDVKEDNLKDLSFADVMYVHDVVYIANDEYISLLMGGDL